MVKQKKMETVENYETKMKLKQKSHFKILWQKHNAIHYGNKTEIHCE